MRKKEEKEEDTINWDVDVREVDLKVGEDEKRKFDRSIPTNFKSLPFFARFFAESLTIESTTFRRILFFFFCFFIVSSSFPFFAFLSSRVNDLSSSVNFLHFRTSWNPR